MHLFHPNRALSHPTTTLSLQSNTIVVVSLLSDGNVDLNNESIGICSRNGHVLGDGDTKAEFADGGVGSEIDLNCQLHGTKRSLHIIESSFVVFSCLVMIRGRNRTTKWVTFVCI